MGHKGKLLIIGSTGMLGRSLTAEAINRGYDTYTASRSSSDLYIDITDVNSIMVVVDKVNPDIIINAAAIVNLTECEIDPGKAYLVNARPAAILADISSARGIYNIHISTDHYFSGDFMQLHDEKYPVRLLNEYARTKYAGETYALTCPKSLVVRTNIVGFRGRADQQTFVEWVIYSLRNEHKMTLFDDFYTSSISTKQLSRTLFDVIDRREIYGTLNIASKGAYSKKDFIEKLARCFGYGLVHSYSGSVHDLPGVQRADSLGLNVSRVEKIVGYEMPYLDDVINQLYEDYMEEQKNGLCQ
ncbi:MULTISPECIES: SDR family oxidoreductase [Paenibacillus]|uniref:SDR family oxidoreductase n=1 Tax=Paenibacillus TaxID=44249 RepID=UPI002FE15013